MSGSRLTRSGGMRWLAWLIAGPTLWAFAFSAAYGLHGLGCELAWPLVTLGPVSLHRVAILLVGAAAALTCLGLLPVAGKRLGPDAGLPRLGLWIGFVATLFSLAPTFVASSC